MVAKYVRVGVLGCGRVADHYRKILLEIHPIPEFKIIACCDLLISKARSFSEYFSCNYYGSLDEMLGTEELDIVLILTPSGSHFENAKYTLEKGINVIVEKPITLKPAHAQELEKVALDNGCSCSSLFQNRYNPAVVAVKNAVDAGRFGKIVTAGIRLRWCRYQDYYEDGWHGTWSQDGGVINQQAIHHLDALNWICGPVEQVIASMDNRINVLEAEDTMVALLRFSNSALGTIEATTAARPVDIEASLSIVGEKGTVQIGGIALNKIIDWEFVEELDEDFSMKTNSSEDVETGYGVSHYRFIEDFVNGFFNAKSDLPLSIGEAVKAVELVHALYCSAENGKWVKLEDEPRSCKLGSTN